jgi:hypothetical protein
MSQTIFSNKTVGPSYATDSTAVQVTGNWSNFTIDFTLVNGSRPPTQGAELTLHYLVSNTDLGSTPTTVGLEASGIFVFNVHGNANATNTFSVSLPPINLSLSGQYLYCWLTNDICANSFTLSAVVTSNSTGITPDISDTIADQKVGINNTSPDYTLDVAGDINYTGTLNNNGSPVNFGTVFSVLSESNGKVGVGQSSPKYLLDVNGDLNFTGSLKHNGVAVSLSGSSGTKVSRDAIHAYHFDNSLDDSIGTANFSSANSPSYSSSNGAGDSGFIEVNTSGQLTATVSDIPLEATARTINFWFSSAAIGLDGIGLLSYGDYSSPGNVFEFLLNDDSVHSIWLHVLGTQVIWDTGNGFNPVDGNLHMVTGTYDGTTLILYIDGVAVASTTVSLSTASSTLFVGTRADNTGAYTGNFDELTIWDFALSPTQIATLYTTGGGVTSPLSLTGLIINPANPNSSSVYLKNTNGTNTLWSQEYTHTSTQDFSPPRHFAEPTNAYVPTTSDNTGGAGLYSYAWNLCSSSIGGDNRYAVGVCTVFGAGGVYGSKFELLTKRASSYSNASGNFNHNLVLDGYGHVGIGNNPESEHTIDIKLPAWCQIRPATADAPQLWLESSETYSGASTNGHFRSNGTNIALTQDGSTGTILTTANVLTANITKTLFNHYADVNNTSTTETDLYSDSVAANQLLNNGDKLVAQYGGTFAGGATSNQTLKAYFGGTNIFSSGALGVGTGTTYWNIDVTCIRESSTIVRCSAVLTTSFATLMASSKYTKITSLTLTNAQILKITGQAGGAGGASNQITASEGFVQFIPA